MMEKLQNMNLATRIAALMVLAMTIACLAACSGGAPASSSSADAPSDNGSESSIDNGTGGEDYFLYFNGYPYDEGYYMPGESMRYTVEISEWTDEDEIKPMQDVSFNWDVAPELKAQADDDTFVVESLPGPGEYDFTATAVDAEGNQLHSETHTIVVKDEPKLTLTAALEEEKGTKIDSCKTGDYLAFMLEGCEWPWADSDGAFVEWEAKNLDTGEVYNNETGLPDLEPGKNGGIEGEAFGEYDYPALLATFANPGTYEITGSLVRASGKRISSSTTITVS